MILDYKEDDDFYYIFYLMKAKIIENIYINGNTWIKDELINKNYHSKNNFF